MISPSENKTDLQSLESQSIHSNNENPHSRLSKTPMMTPLFLLEELQENSKYLDQKSLELIKSYVQYRQIKVYLGQTSNQNDYLASIFQNSISASQQLQIKCLVSERQNLVIDQIKNSQIQIAQQSRNNDTDNSNIHRIKSQLNSKLKQMNQQMIGLANDDSDYLNCQIDHSGSLMNQFKKPHYWKDEKFNQSSEKVKMFLSRIKKEKKQTEKQFEQDLEKSKNKYDQKLALSREELKNKKKDQYMKNLERQYRQKAKKRKSYFLDTREKSKEISAFLKKYKDKQCLHLRYEKNYQETQKQIVKQRQNILNGIKQNHPSYDPEQINDHINKYDEVKGKYQKERQSREDGESKMLQRQSKYLRQLYHSQFHASIKAEHNPQKERQTSPSLENTRSKMMTYAQTIKEDFQPVIDPKKRKQLTEAIRVLEQKNDPNLKKIDKGNGVYQFQVKKDPDSYKKGVGYLEQLRSLNQLNKSRSSMKSSKRYQDRTKSMMEFNHPKKIDYLRESRLSTNKKPSIAGWKTLLEEKSYTPLQKLESVKNKAESLQFYSNQKHVQLRNNRKKNNSSDMLDLREQSDKYLLQSIEARLGVLKSVIKP